MSGNSSCESYPWTALLEALGGVGNVTYEYTLACMQVVEGRAQFLGVVPGNGGATAVFKTLDGEVFTVFSPEVTEVERGELRALLGEVLKTTDVETLRRFLGDEDK